MNVLPPASRVTRTLSVRTVFQLPVGAKVSVTAQPPLRLNRAVREVRSPLMYEITSRAGAFAVARDLKGADPAFPGVMVILLERTQDEWLARWSGADVWFDKPVNPFELGDAVAGLLEARQKEAV